MGHREDLLAGAKRCLFEKGYARTTARDVVAASGTNLASIGYHFGSKEALLNAALLEALDEISREFSRVSVERIRAGMSDLEGTWQVVFDAFAEYRPLLIAQVEAWAQAERSSELREQFAALYERQRIAMAAIFQELLPEVDERTARSMGTLIMAIGDGVFLQWLFDPDNPPTGEDIATGMRALTATTDDFGERYRSV